MQQFQVPQFIEVEDKIFGPLTLKQFLYLVGGGAIIFFIWVLVPYFWLFLLLSAPVGAFSAALAFLIINGRPFVVIVASALSHYTGSRLFLWQPASKPKKEAAVSPKEPLQIPTLTESRLKELAWSLDINEKIKR